MSLNEKGGVKNIGRLHAVEFCCVGQDNDKGPGFARLRGRPGPHADRRRQYLRLAAHLLVQNLGRVVDEWSAGGTSNYRARFLAMPPDEALTCILKGLGILSGAELAGERLTVPYETKDQEDEHSCFSDNTQRDIVEDTIGIQNVFLGRYVRASGQRVEGRSLRELLTLVDPTLSTTLDRQIEASVAAANAVPAPFDQTILGTDSAPGRVAVKKLITALRAQADSIARAGRVLGLKLNF